MLAKTLLKKIFDFFLFTSFFIACCAVMMVYQTYTLVIVQPVNFYFSAFVFFSTVCSYNFHWFLTPHSVKPSIRLQWAINHKYYHFILFLIGMTGAIVFFYFLIEHWVYLGIAVLLSFLYSAPKIALSPFQWLKRIAIGKTIFLAAAWTYVTAVLPIIIENIAWTQIAILFCIGQFFFIYAICILFDYRDKDDDKAEGIRSMITYFNEQGINRLFWSSLLIFLSLALLLKLSGFLWITIIIMSFPGLLLASLYNFVKKNYSDYLYFFVLDGLMMLSGLLLWLMNRF